jgi:hypothetical protein
VNVTYPDSLSDARLRQAVRDLDSASITLLSSAALPDVLNADNAESDLRTLLNSRREFRRGNTQETPAERFHKFTDLKAATIL